MKYPKTVTFGGYTFKVIVKDKPSKKYLGLFNPKKSKITFWKAETDDQDMHIFFHECLHAALWVMRHNDWSNEDVVDVLSNYMFGVVKNIK